MDMETRVSKLEQTAIINGARITTLEADNAKLKISLMNARIVDVAVCVVALIIGVMLYLK